MWTFVVNMNIESAEDRPKREAIARAVLAELGAFL